MGSTLAERQHLCCHPRPLCPSGAPLILQLRSVGGIASVGDIVGVSPVLQGGIDERRAAFKRGHDHPSVAARVDQQLHARRTHRVRAVDREQLVFHLK